MPALGLQQQVFRDVGLVSGRRHALDKGGQRFAFVQFGAAYRFAKVGPVQQRVDLVTVVNINVLAHRRAVELLQVAQRFFDIVLRIARGAAELEVQQLITLGHRRALSVAFGQRALGLSCAAGLGCGELALTDVPDALGVDGVLRNLFGCLGDVGCRAGGFFQRAQLGGDESRPHLVLHQLVGRARHRLGVGNLAVALQHALIGYAIDHHARALGLGQRLDHRVGVGEAKHVGNDARVQAFGVGHAQLRQTCVLLGVRILDRGGVQFAGIQRSVGWRCRPSVGLGWRSRLGILLVIVQHGPLDVQINPGAVLRQPLAFDQTGVLAGLWGDARRFPGRRTQAGLGGGLMLGARLLPHPHRLLVLGVHLVWQRGGVAPGQEGPGPVDRLAHHLRAHLALNSLAGLGALLLHGLQAGRAQPIHPCHVLERLPRQRLNGLLGGVLALRLVGRPFLGRHARLLWRVEQRHVLSCQLSLVDCVLAGDHAVKHPAHLRREISRCALERLVHVDHPGPKAREQAAHLQRWRLAAHEVGLPAGGELLMQCALLVHAHAVPLVQITDAAPLQQGSHVGLDLRVRVCLSRQVRHRVEEEVA